MTTRRLLDSDEALRRLETRLGPLHAQLRLGMEREHEAQAFGQGLSFLHLENLPLMQAMIEIALRVTGTYWGRRRIFPKEHAKDRPGTRPQILLSANPSGRPVFAFNASCPAKFRFSDQIQTL